VECQIWIFQQIVSNNQKYLFISANWVEVLLISVDPMVRRILIQIQAICIHIQIPLTLALTWVILGTISSKEWLAQ